MDTVSNLPFILSVNGNSCEQFATSEEKIYYDDFATIKIVENEEITILFNSSDSSARLYLDALDILPDGNDVLIDEEGRIYRLASATPFPLYKQGNDYDALRVDAFRICVTCEVKKYYHIYSFS